MTFNERSRKKREDGKLGLNKGIPLPKDFKRLQEYISNIQPLYYLVASDSGVGKTKIAHFLFLYNTIVQYIEKNIEDFEIHYYTVEMTLDEIIAECQAFFIFTKYKKLTDISQIYSLGNNKIPKVIDDMLDNEYLTKIIDILETKVKIITERVSPKFLYKEIEKAARANGEIITESINDINVVKEYKKHNPNKWIIFMFDNYQKLKPHQGQDLREAINELSSYFDRARNLYSFVMVAMQQINRNSKSFDRYKLGQYFSSEQDLKDSEGSFHDCQVAIVLLSPYKLGLKDFEGYDIKKTKNGLKDRMRALKIIKNRGGMAYVVDYMLFLGENAVFKELPYSENLKDEHYLQIKNIKKEENIDERNKV